MVIYKVPPRVRYENERGEDRALSHTLTAERRERRVCGDGRSVSRKDGQGRDVDVPVRRGRGDGGAVERMPASVDPPNLADAPRRRESVGDAVMMAARYGQVGHDTECGRLKTATMRDIPPLPSPSMRCRTQGVRTPSWSSPRSRRHTEQERREPQREDVPPLLLHPIWTAPRKGSPGDASSARREGQTSKWPSCRMRGVRGA
ncbi:hypothetical protein C8J57DRAFT_1402498, partial [Mycena rebaudengoi]